MQGKWFNRIFTITILLGMLLPSTASGSHLDSLFPNSGPPKIHKSRPVGKQIAPIRKTPVSLPQGIFNQTAPSPTEPPSLATGAEQKKHTPKSQANLGWRFLLNKQPQAAMTAYREAVRQNPKSARAYLGLGISLKSLGKVGLAKKALLKAVNLNPRLPSALVHLGYLYAEGHLGESDFSTARRLFQEASQLGDPFASIALLELNFRSKL